MFCLMNTRTEHPIIRKTWLPFLWNPRLSWGCKTVTATSPKPESFAGDTRPWWCSSISYTSTSSNQDAVKSDVGRVEADHRRDGSGKQTIVPVRQPQTIHSFGNVPSIFFWIFSSQTNLWTQSGHWSLSHAEAKEAWSDCERSLIWLASFFLDGFMCPLQAWVESRAHFVIETYTPLCFGSD